MTVIRHPTLALSELVSRFSSAGELPALLDAVAMAQLHNLDVTSVVVALQHRAVKWNVERDQRLLESTLATVAGLTAERTSSQTDSAVADAIKLRRSALLRGEPARSSGELSPDEFVVEYFAQGGARDEQAAASRYQPFAVAANHDSLLEFLGDSDPAAVIADYMRDSTTFENPAWPGTPALTRDVTPQIAALLASLCCEFVHDQCLQRAETLSAADQQLSPNDCREWECVAAVLNSAASGQPAQIVGLIPELLTIGSARFSMAWHLAWRLSLCGTAIGHALTAVLIEPDNAVRLASVRELHPDTVVDYVPQLDWTTATSCINAAWDLDDDDLATVDQHSVLCQWIEAAKRHIVDDRIPGRRTDLSTWMSFWSSIERIDLDFVCQELRARKFPATALLLMYCGSPTSPMHGPLSLEFFTKDDPSFWDRDFHPGFRSLAEAAIRDDLLELAAAIVGYWLFFSCVGFHIGRAASEAIVPRMPFTRFWRELEGGPGFKLLLSTTERSMHLVAGKAGGSVERRAIQSLVDHSVPAGRASVQATPVSRADAEKTIRSKLGSRTWMALSAETKGLLVDGTVQWSSCHHLIGGGMLDWAGVMSPFFRAFEVDTMFRAKQLFADPEYLAYAASGGVRGPPTLGTLVHLVDRRDVLTAGLAAALDSHLGCLSRTLRKELRTLHRLRNAASHAGGNSLSDFVELHKLLFQGGLLHALTSQPDP